MKKIETRKLSNVEIANYVFEKLSERNFEVDFNKILEDIDISLENSTEIVTNEDGNIVYEMSEEEIQKIKENFLNSFLAEKD